MDVQPEQSTGDEQAAIRARLEAELESHTPRRTMVVNNGDPRPGCTNHLADSASESEFRFTDDALRAVLNQTAERVRHAIRKLDQGTYGVCDPCGGKIEEERLQACVYAADCCSCIKKRSPRRH